MPVVEESLEEMVAALGPAVVAESYRPGRGLPVFIEPVEGAFPAGVPAAAEWMECHQALLDRLLAVSGAFVVRGFGVDSTADFNRLVEHLPSTDFGYAGGNTRRERIEGRVFEATALPATEKITLHQEMAYLPHYPTKVAFFCLQPSETGGETILCDMRSVERRLPADFVETVRERGVLYLRNFRAPDAATGIPMLDAFHKTWQEAFFTSDRAEVESICTAMGLEYEWQSDGSMNTSFHASGFAAHPLTHQEVWFNHVHAMSFVRDSISDEHYEAQEGFYGSSTMIRPYRVVYGDGEPMPEAVIRAIYPIFDELTVAFPWRHGDVMFVDNILTCHGRNPYTGKRDVQVALFR